MNLPAAPEAEAAAIGSMLLSRGAVETVMDRCLPEDFSNTKLCLVYGAMLDLYHAGAPIDPVTVTQRLAETGGEREVGGLHTVLRIQASTPASANAIAYAETVARYGASRRAMFVGQAITEAGGNADLDAVDDVLDSAHARIAPPAPVIEPATPVLEFLAEVETTASWLVRETLEVGDRMIVTGEEGGGKSVWLRQLAWQIASGLHPFLKTGEPRRRVLHVDCENSAPQVARGYRMLAGVRPTDADLPLFVTCRPQGLDLTTRRDAAWLSALVDLHEAEVLVIGPLYKLHRPAEEGERSGEGVAAATAAAFDRIRAAYGTAMLIEAHAPHAERKDYRPLGSSLWRRWPEFGFGMKPAAADEHGRPQVTIEKWRGPRDDTRLWPSALVRMDGAGTWPWVPLGVEVPY